MAPQSLREATHTLRDVKITHNTIYRISLSYLLHPVLHLQSAKMRAFSLHSLFGFDPFHGFRMLLQLVSLSNIYNGLVFENATHFTFLPCYLKNHSHTDQWMLLKLIYRVGRAANHQSTTDMENYERRPLNKPITAIMSQHTWKCTTNSDIIWQNWTHKWVVARA